MNQARFVFVQWKFGPLWFRLAERVSWFLIRIELIRFASAGECTKTTSHFLQEMQVPQIAQSDTVQEVEGTFSGPRQTSLRSETARFRWSNQAHLQKEGNSINCDSQYHDVIISFVFVFRLAGKDNKENRTPYGMYWMQVPQANSIEALQAFRIGWWQEAQGSNDPVLNELTFHLSWWPFLSFYMIFDLLNGPQQQQHKTTTNKMGI